MEKNRDVYENEFTEENQPDGPQREEGAEHLRADPGIDSQEDDQSMSDNVFGRNNPKKGAP